ncbi:MAG: PilT/PilU family type 4a pilus ATPase [Deltaproteobacteria bacterium]|nr:MAG: PilT/PilU family type 4a pilus ATPase [Deltaproteobacteria bacterium]
MALLSGRELVATFRASAWPDSQSVQTFIQAAGRPSPGDLTEMLKILLDPRAMAEGKPHALRCVVFGKIAGKAPDRSLFVPYIKALRQGDSRVRQLLAQLLPQVNSPSDHAHLVGLMREPDFELRRQVAELIGQIGSQQTFDELGRLCARADFIGRREALEALASLGGLRALPAVLGVLESGSEEERIFALGLLRRLFRDGEVQVPHAVFQALEAQVRDPRESTSMASMRVFTELAPEDVYIDMLERLQGSLRPAVLRLAIAGMGRFRSGKALRKLRELYRAGARSVKLAVLDTLGRVGGEESLDLIAEALNAKHLNVRMKAAEVLQALSERGEVDVARTVIWLLRSRDQDVRRLAAEVARSVRDEEGVFWPKLLTFLRDEDWWVRERITDALTELAGTKLTRYAYTFLEEESAVLRRFGVDMLMRLQDPASLGRLVRQVQSDDDWWVRERSIEAIGHLGDRRAVPYLIDLMQKEPSLRMIGVESLEMLGGEEAAAYLAHLVSDESYHEERDLRLFALRALGKIGTADHAVAVEPLLREDDQELRQIATDLLLRWSVLESAFQAQRTLAGQLSSLDQILLLARQQNADDVILCASRPPYIKALGAVRPLNETPLTSEQIEALILPCLTDAQRDALLELQDLDFSHEVKGQNWRYRVNVFYQQTGVAAVFRQIGEHLPQLEELGLPEAVRKFGDYANGLVLVGGPTGSGKSTTLAALIDYINRRYPRHIITLEDPIEVIHAPRRALINQREIGQHTRSFGMALRSTLREDPDVILVGEMRDLATIAFAITAAETGHLVLGTVHTISADTTVDRLLNTFPPQQQPAVRSILANSLRAICCQQLIPRADGQGRALAVEVMLNNDAVANLIRKGKTYQLPSVLSTAREMGMQSMDNEILRLLRAGDISPEEAYLRALNKKEFEAYIVDYLERGAEEAAAATGPAEGGVY